MDAPVSIGDAPPDVRLIDGCTPVPEICGDGIDQDCDGTDPPCVANDTASGAVDVSAGGTFTVDMTYATNDAPESGCQNAGGRDVFYKITLPAAEVAYLDTFGSDFGTIIRVFAGQDCGQIATVASCSGAACGGAQSQLALSLPAGTSCIVIDQAAGETTGMLTMHVTRGGRDGLPLGAGPQTYQSTSCSGTNATKPSSACAGGDSGTAQDAGYFFTACPAQTLMLDASTCVDSTVTAFDTVVYVRKGGNELGCNDDTSTCAARPARPGHPDGSVLTGVAISGTGLYWLVVDGYNGACGTYRLDTNLR